MKQLRDTVWQRRGTSWLWDAEELAQVSTASEVWSLRQFVQASGPWPDDLPSHDSNTLAVVNVQTLPLVAVSHIVVIILSLVICNLLSKVDQFIELLGRHGNAKDIVNFLLFVKVFHFWVLEVF